MWGCWRLAVVLISVRNRSAPMTAASSGRSTLMATLRSCRRSWARYTVRSDVGVLEVGGGLDLGEEPLGPDDRGQLGPQHLDGDLAVVPKVLGPIHGQIGCGGAGGWRWS